MTQKRMFLGALLLATWLPLILLGISIKHSQMLWLTLLAVSTIHVPSTALFYFDKGFRPIIRQDPVYFIGLPIVVALGSALLFAVSAEQDFWMFLVPFAVWQVSHFGKQSLGVYVFSSMGETGTGATPLERRAIELGTLAGSLGILQTSFSSFTDWPIQHIFEPLFRAGAVVALMALGVGVATLFQKRKRTALQTIFFFSGVCFFAPMFLGRTEFAFLTYAIAHGLQYLVFMAAMAAREPKAEAVSSLGFGKLILILASLGPIYYLLTKVKVFPFLASSPVLVNCLLGLMYGATMAHFLIDASAWKLREKPQREFVKKRFAFLFGS